MHASILKSASDFGDPERTELAPPPQVSESLRALGFAGIDAGKKGCVAIVSADCSVVLDVMPTPLQNAEYDKAAMWSLAKRISARVRFVLLEEQQPYTEQSYTNFATGRGFGLWEMALTAAGVAHASVLPQAWKSFLGILAPRPKPRRGRMDRSTLKAMAKTLRAKLKKGKVLTPEEQAIVADDKQRAKARGERSKEAKRLAIEKADALFPTLNLFRTERSQKADDGVAEAVLIATCAHRQFNGAKIG